MADDVAFPSPTDFMQKYHGTYSVGASTSAASASACSTCAAGTFAHAGAAACSLCRNLAARHRAQAADDVGAADHLPDADSRLVRPLWAEIHDRVMAQLDNLSIEDLRSEADKAGIVIESHNALDFTI